MLGSHTAAHASSRLSSLSYADELRPVRPGKQSRRSPVVKLGATEAELKSQSPGPATYSPRDPNHSSRAFSITGAPPAKLAVDRSPGAIYNVRSSLGQQPTSTLKSSPRYGFGKGERPDALTIARRSSSFYSPDPGTYYDGLSAFNGVGSTGSKKSPRAKSPEIKKFDRAPPGRDGPGPAAYSPRIEATDRRAAPQYSMHGVESKVPTIDSPGPAMYVAKVGRFGAPHIGDGPYFSISAREQEDTRFISKGHSVTMMGMHSPGPASYTPREMVGVVDYTNSNTSTHAPMWAFGSEKRIEIDDGKAKKRLVAKAQEATASPRLSPRSPRLSPRP